MEDSSNLQAAIELLEKEKAALLQALPHPKPGSGESPVQYERIEQKDNNGNTVVLEWHINSGWNIHLHQSGE